MSSQPQKPQFPQQNLDAPTSPETSLSLIHWLKKVNLGRIIVGFWAVSGAIATTLVLAPVQWLENQSQTVFFQVRGKVTPPDNIVIVAIDDYSLDSSNLYLQDPVKYKQFEALERWPWKRAVYAQVIEKLIEAGAKTVALDLVFDTPSGYGKADDQQFLQALKTYQGQVILAAVYERNDPRYGEFENLALPYSFIKTDFLKYGFINYILETDGKIRRLGRVYPQVWAKNNPDLAPVFQETQIPSFDQAIIETVVLFPPKIKGDYINFYGQQNTFAYVPFAEILAQNNWETNLQGGKYFQDKIVLIGTSSQLQQDFHATPFDKQMPGVEIHANAIASILEGRTIGELLPYSWQQGILVLIGSVSIGWVLTRSKHWPLCLGIGIGAAIAWSSVSYVSFVQAQLILPTGVPVVIIVMTSICLAAVGALRELISKLELRQTFKRYASSPIVQEILSQQEDLQDLIAEREQEVLNLILSGRYRILERLSAGGFGETYIAEDIQRPGNPKCVVKQLRPVSNNPKHWQLARRLFLKEAEMLEKLGKHDQIPQLLAYFTESGEFYLVQEWIEGHTLNQELPMMIPLQESKVVAILYDILSILTFIHSQGVIHRDIKPENIIRREKDDKLVLIDFGTVKELSTQIQEGDLSANLTVAIGTKGYTPKEQSAGKPRFNSDIYATGMIGIKALTLLHPSYLEEDLKTGEMIWEDKIPEPNNINPELLAILRKMVKADWRDRYQTVTEVLADLQPLIRKIPTSSLHKGVTLNDDQGTNLISESEAEMLTLPASEPTSSTALEDENHFSE